MEHCAIDLGARESQLCVRDEGGKIILERRCPTARLGAYLKRRPFSRVIVETSAEAFWIADAATECGHEVRVVSSMLVRALGVGARGIKNDQRDARALSEASCRMDLPSVHVRSTTARERAAVCGMRQVLVKTRTQLINAVRGQARTRAVVITGGGTNTFPRRMRTRMAQHPDGLSEGMDRVLQTLEVLNTQIDAADKELQALAAQDETCRLLMTVPGVGPLTAARFTAALDEVKRFGGAHAVESYLGLTPGENSSAERQRRTSITKAGSPEVRWTLVQAAWSLMRTRPHDPMTQWAEAVAQRRGRKIAVVALARKLAGVLYAMWRDRTTYEARKPQPTSATQTSSA